MHLHVKRNDKLSQVKQLFCLFELSAAFKQLKREIYTHVGQNYSQQSKNKGLINCYSLGFTTTTYY